LIQFQARYFEEHAMQVYENAGIIFGFSEINFSAAALKRFFQPQPLLFLKQIHSARIIKAREWQAGSESDGLLLEKPGVVAVIQTADCLPLFFLPTISRSAASSMSAGAVFARGLKKIFWKCCPGI
jgi:hypothetical protein